ncbi:MAG: hypothetical protein ACK4PR_12305, partial [Gammaproteobacteria bacterium]
LAFSGCGTELASGSSDSTVRLWDLIKGGVRVLREHTGLVRCLAYSQQDTLLASGSDDMTVRLWDPKQGSCQQVIDLPSRILTLSWCGTFLYIGMRARNNIVLSIAYDRSIKGYQCYSVFNPANISIAWQNSFKQLNIEKARGLTLFRHRFLATQGAIGKPDLPKKEPVKTEILQIEHSELNRLNGIKDILIRATSPRAKPLSDNNRVSLFKPKLTINYQEWQVYLIRAQTNSSISKSQQAIGEDNQTYAVLEGLTQQGQSLFIRFSLEQDKADAQYGRVNIKSLSLTKGTNLEQMKRSCLELLKAEEETCLSELDVYHAGYLSLTDIDDLLSMLLYEAARQQPDKDETKRIIYQTKDNDNKLNVGYNSLTWLRSLLKGYKSLQLPRSVVDFFYTMPKTSKATSHLQPGLFAPVPNEIIQIDISKWLPENSVQLKIKK